MPHRSRLSRRLARSLPFALLAAALCTPAFAQTVRDKILQENPSRTPGGSCIYGGDGRLIYAPRGALCPESEGGAAPPASMAADDERHAPARAAAPTPPVSAAPALPRERIAALLAERERMDVELARMREALAYEDREAARRVVDDALGKLARHLENEARVLQPLAGDAR
jgi:hypothetical protein